MSWIISDREYNKEKIESNGNKYLLANGYMGYRGTLEEYTKEQYTGCILAGLYDQVDGKWREPVNSPNGMYVKIYCDGESLTVLDNNLQEHNQSLDIKYALVQRNTIFAKKDNQVTIKSERFLSVDDVHLLCLKYSFTTTKNCKITIETGIDGDVWDINGPHLREINSGVTDDILSLKAVTNELQKQIVIAEIVEFDYGQQSIEQTTDKIFRKIELDAAAGAAYEFIKYVAVYTDNDKKSDLTQACLETLTGSSELGYAKCLARHKMIWAARWAKADIVIEGDPEAQLALRYSIYHLLAAAPTHTDSLSIPARGLSSQVYKGAIFWDTELYMLPFFIYTNPEIARNIVNYRINTLAGARRKAKEYGYRGAYYAWESQDTGDDACTHFNITDVFTGRPMRTYFRDKQIHISADVVYGIWNYYHVTGDFSILFEGGAEVILECARFYYSYSYFNRDTGNYEILDVTGPDEYHERVNNNAYTNLMAKYVVGVAIKVLGILKIENQQVYETLFEELDYGTDYVNICDYYENLYIPEPDSDTQIIEQFDSYFKLEDISIDELKGAMLESNEYLGGANGLATRTQILKQADVVLMLNLFKNMYSTQVKRANWEYYEPRTEHGSSLSSCVYAMQAAHLQKTDYAYKYFMKTATIDLTGDYKQYVGDLFIGGTHLASNGGAWLAAIFGFAGLELFEDKLQFKPSLPAGWKSMKFNLQIKGKALGVEITDDQIRVTAQGSLKVEV